MAVRIFKTRKNVVTYQRIKSNCVEFIWSMYNIYKYAIKEMYSVWNAVLKSLVHWSLIRVWRPPEEREQSRAGRVL